MCHAFLGTYFWTVGSGQISRTRFWPTSSVKGNDPPTKRHDYYFFPFFSGFPEMNRSWPRRCSANTSSCGFYETVPVFPLGRRGTYAEPGVWFGGRQRLPGHTQRYSSTRANAVFARAREAKGYGASAASACMRSASPSIRACRPRGPRSSINGPAWRSKL